MKKFPLINTLQSFSSFRSGFTLVELLVTISVIGVLATIVLLAVNPVKQFARARDSIRKSDLRQVANALERYHTVNGSYPLASNWHSSCATWDAGNPRGTSGPNGWVPNLAPNDIKVLPLDPVRKTGIGAMANSLFPSVPASVMTYCYIYLSNGVDR